MAEQTPLQEDINELKAGQPDDPEAAAIVDQWQAEHDAARRQALQDLGTTQAPTLVEMPDGSVETQDSVQRAVEEGQDLNGAYNQGRRA